MGQQSTKNKEQQEKAQEKNNYRMLHSLMIWFFSLLFLFMGTLMAFKVFLFVVHTIVYLGCRSYRKSYDEGLREINYSSMNIRYTGNNIKKEGFVSRYPIRKHWARPRGPGSRHFKTGYL